MTGQRPLLLVVDDDRGMLDRVGQFARGVGFEVVECSTGHAAIAQLQSLRADLIIVDLRLADTGGLDILGAIREMDPHCQAVLMTDCASIETAVEAIKLGATDYLSKPLDFRRLEHVLNGVREDLERRRSVLSVEGDLARRLELCGMIGRGPAMQELFDTIRRLALHVRTALIWGETGTGKELAARAFHRIGPRRGRRFLTANCSAQTDAVLESELFGHLRGACTGAAETKPGLFEQADGGTIFLDEIGDLPLRLQPRLLRVLETGEVHRVGSLESRKVNVQVIAATTRDLRSDVAAGRFRSDLFYRLNVVELRLPALRDRREDIPYLTAAFVRESSERLRKPLFGLTPGAERLLTTARWDGNVRELRNVLERACILADGDFITERELAACMPPPARHAVPASADGMAHPAGADLLVNVERDHIQRALERAGGNKKAAAQMLGLSRRALYRRLERLDLAATISRRRDSALVEAQGR